MVKFQIYPGMEIVNCCLEMSLLFRQKEKYREGSDGDWARELLFHMAKFRIYLEYSQVRMRLYILCGKSIAKKRLNGPFREEIWFHTEIKFPLVSYFLDMLFYIQILWHEDLCKIDVANSQ